MVSKNSQKTNKNYRMHLDFGSTESFKKTNETGLDKSYVICNFAAQPFKVITATKPFLYF